MTESRNGVGDQFVAELLVDGDPSQCLINGCHTGTRPRTALSGIEWAVLIPGSGEYSVAYDEAVQRGWPLVGRTDELSRILECVSAGRSVVLIGAAGVGKSRLAAEVSAQMAPAGGTPRRISGTPAGATVPYAALAGLLQSSDGDVLAAVTVQLRRASADDPVPVLHVDDLHHFDDASATVLHQLLTAGVARMVGTQREGEPLSDSVAALIADVGVERHQLHSLSDDAVGELVRAALDGPVDGSTLHQLASLSQGNVLFLRELIEGSLLTGALSQEAGLWRLRSEVGSTPLLDELIAARLAPLDPALREAAEVLSLSEPAALDILEQVVPLRALEDLERAGVATVGADLQGLTASLVHPLYGEQLRARMPAIARLRLSRLLADAVDKVRPPDNRSVSDDLRAAVWRIDGGTTGDAEQLLRAAHVAFSAGNTMLAGRLAAASFDADGNIDAALLGSWCRDEHGDNDGARDLLQRGRAKAFEARDRAYLGIREAEQHWWTRREQPEALAIIDEMTAAGGIESNFATAQRAVFAVLSGDPARALTILDALDEQQLEDPWVGANASLARALSYLLSGRAEQGAALASAAFERATAAPPGETNGDPGVHIATRCFNQVAAGELAEAEELAILIYEVAISRPGLQARAWGAMLRGEVALGQGRLVDSQHWYTEGEVAWLGAKLPGPARWCAMGVALALALQGDVASLDATLARVRSYDQRGFEMQNSRFGRAEAWSLYLNGGRAAARDLLVETSRDWTSRGADHAAFEVAVDLVRMGEHEAASEVVTSVNVEGPLSVARKSVVHALCADDAAMLDTASEQLETMGALLEAAEAAAFASQSHRRGRRAAADASAGRSRALAARCQGAATPPLESREATKSISARELEVAKLAASGLSNKAIAERLVVSERTVENHLYRVFAKLGVTSRDQIAEALPT